MIRMKIYEKKNAKAKASISEKKENAKAKASISEKRLLMLDDTSENENMRKDDLIIEVSK